LGPVTMNNKELIGDALLIAFGVILIYIFVVIEVMGFYGQEANKYIRWAELVMGIPVILIGIERLLDDIKAKK